MKPQDFGYQHKAQVPTWQQPSAAIETKGEHKCPAHGLRLTDVHFEKATYGSSLVGRCAAYDCGLVVIGSATKQGPPPRDYYGEARRQDELEARSKTSAASSQRPAQPVRSAKSAKVSAATRKRLMRRYVDLLLKRAGGAR